MPSKWPYHNRRDGIVMSQMAVSQVLVILDTPPFGNTNTLLNVIEVEVELRKKQSSENFP